ncbi:MAG: protein-L-isoaspartate(D-aspartate) O-methyltransferase [Candidatus Adiutrix sp.]|jgi:protein-L-isoaspartate(D-aspartate) O-methyltransferase|nr:protein-L-isoaspartate(D-aspartate) O-methyltransferase [Candidatus Adiutrix sp.]
MSDVAASNPEAYRIARRKMVEAQLKARGINEPRLLEAMGRVPRHFFVDEALAAQSYSDSPLPIGYGQTISQPYIVAFMIEALALAAADRVLEIGSGSGYQTAILAALSGEVFAVERLKPIFLKGRANLEKLGLSNIRLKLDDGTLGWPEMAPYDVIIVAAGGPKAPPPLIEQLAPGGRLIVPVGPSADKQQLLFLRKDSQGGLSRSLLGGCRFVNLVGRHGW